MATILIVDDRQTNRDYLVTLLGYSNHRLLQAPDGAKAFVIATAERPDLIISDILMPTMDGYEFVRRLRGTPTTAKTPVIFYTATFHEHEARALAEACGVSQVLFKPCPPEAILHAVNQSLGLLPQPDPLVGAETFSQEHLRLLTNKLADKVDELEREIEQRKRAETELQEAAALLRILSSQLMTAQESERRRIAQELHDEVGQALSTLRLNLHALERARSPEERASCVRDSVELVEQTLQQVRDLSLDLRPSVLDHLGLVPALEWQLNRLADRGGFRARFRAEGVLERLPIGLETTCFRVVQEALTNVIRHARARRVAVVVRQTNRHLILTVRDDGVGFDVKATAVRARAGDSMGLLGMRERVRLCGGELSLRSVPGRGTRISVRFPLADVSLAAGNDQRSIAP